MTTEPSPALMTTSLVAVPSRMANAKSRIDFSRVRFPYEELGDIPPAPLVRISCFTGGRPRDKVYIDRIIRRLLETIREQQVTFYSAAPVVAKEEGKSPEAIRQRYSAFKTTSEERAGDVYGAVRRRREAAFIKAMEEKDYPTFFDVSKEVARGEFMDEIGQVDAVTLMNTIYKSTNIKFIDMVYERWPHIGLCDDHDIPL